MVDWPTGNTVHIAILEDAKLTRVGLEAILADVDEFEIVCSTHNAAEFLDFANHGQIDVAFLDLRLQGSFELGLTTLEKLKELSPHTKCIVVTAFASGQNFMRVLDLDAEAFVCKDTYPDENPDMVELVLKIMNGQRYYDPAAVLMLRPSNVNDAKIEASETAGFNSTENPLTVRETEMLQAAANGLKNKQIAQKFSIAESTVKTHLSNIYGKLGVNDRSQAILLAKLNGWLS